MGNSTRLFVRMYNHMSSSFVSSRLVFVPYQYHYQYGIILACSGLPRLA